MGRSVAILKLGGSVITYKDLPLTPNVRAIRNIAKAIPRDVVGRLVVVHGGGSFGHWAAKTYSLSSEDPFERAANFSVIRWAMESLNNVITKLLIEAGLPACSLQTSALVVNKSGEIGEDRLEIVSRFLSMGLIPVMFGDAVLDSEAGFSIASGDSLCAQLVERLEAERVVFAVDVDGVYTSDPKTNPDAQLVKDLSVSSLSDIEIRSASSAYDVTGGMIKKLEEILSVVKKGAVVYVVNGFFPDRVRDALLGRKVIGTVIRR